jgi:hypothetical protein
LIDFLRAIGGAREPLVDGREGHKSAEIILAIYRSFVLLWCSSRGIALTKTIGLAVSVPTGWLLVLGGFSALTLVMAALAVLALHSREIIQIDGQAIAVRTEGYCYSFVRKAVQVFPLGDVRNLRYAPKLRRGGRGGDLPYGFSIVFDCKRSTGRFGFNLSEPESRRLIKTIRDRYKIPGDRVDSLPVEGHDGNVKTPPEQRTPRRRSFSPPILSRVASDEINGFVITIPNVSNEFPTWVIVASCTVAVPFISLALFGLFAGVIIPILGRPVSLSLGDEKRRKGETKRCQRRDEKERRKGVRNLFN